MATHGYHVEIGALRAAADRLRQDGEYLAAERGKVATAAVPDPAFARGTSSAPAAAAWRAALSGLDRRLGALATKLGTSGGSLTTVAANYERSDQHIAGLFARLHRGSHGHAVTELQRFLRDAGFDPGTIDGSYGPRTAAAVAAFTHQNPYPPTPAH